MRKHQKKKLQNFINTLYEAHDEIKKSVEAELPEQAMGLLAQCQEAAIKIGSLIEETEGETFVTIGFLEHYCELLYHIHEELSAGKAGSAGKVHKLLRKKLISVENSIKNDIPVQIEAVFLPYKASMWDSLESVWQAAEEDQNCNAYVMPIPYFDRNPDGSFGEMHYEGEQFPAYVPITHYESYPLSEQCPDVIFIHNPYDEQNYVTSVHPAFYSSTLKQCTDCLVYIPYFVTGEIPPDNNRMKKSISHFCTTPGVLHADKVIVQSEGIRQLYIRVLTEYAGEKTGPYWEQKILGMGSPKIEKIIHTEREKMHIPENWMKVIQRQDGGRKPVVLYNTSISSLLQNNDKMLQKMQDVFRTFKEKTDEYAFWWRPHPLIPATLRSMRPGLWEKYKAMKEDYCREGWGIYDDSSDVDRAVVVSDVYYGDGSSLIELYRYTGKPIMVQDVNRSMKTQKEQSIVTFNACGLWNRYLYFFSNTDSIFSRMNPETGAVEFLDVSPGYFQGYGQVIERLYLKGHFIYALEAGGDHLLVVDLKKQEGSLVKIDCYQNDTENYTAIAGWNGYVYIFLKYKNKIVRIDEITLQQSELIIDQSLKEAPEFDHACSFGSKMLLISSQEDKLFAFDMKTEKLEKMLLPEPLKDCRSIVWKYSKFWLLTNKGEVKRLNDRFELEHVIEAKAAYNLGGSHVERMEVTKTRIIMLPGTGQDIFLVDLETDEIKVYDDYPEDFTYIRDKSWSKYMESYETDHEYYCPMRAANYLLKIDRDNGTLSWIRPKSPSVKERMDCCQKNKDWFFRETNFPLQAMLDTLTKETIPYKGGSRCGREIWKAVKSTVVL